MASKNWAPAKAGKSRKRRPLLFMSQAREIFNWRFSSCGGVKDRYSVGRGRYTTMSLPPTFMHSSVCVCVGGYISFKESFAFSTYTWCAREGDEGFFATAGPDRTHCYRQRSDATLCCTYRSWKELNGKLAWRRTLRKYFWQRLRSPEIVALSMCPYQMEEDVALSVHLLVHAM